MGVSKRLLCVFTAMFVSLCSFATPVSAAEASSADGIGTSLYDVTTSLTAFINNVVGPNTNDEYENHIPPDSLGAGNAGAYVGYGDESNGFYPYISSSESKSVTSSSYDAWLNVDSAGVGQSIYAYVRYGYLLNDLGLDETAIEGDDGMLRPTFGMLMQGVNLIASALPKLFELFLNLMSWLNPFRFFVNSADNIGSMNNDSGDNIFDLTGNTTIDGILEPVMDVVSQVYDMIKQMGVYVIIPLFVVVLLWGLLMSKTGSKGSKILVFVERLAFVAIGVPLLAFLYTSTLTQLGTVIQESPATAQMVTCTFVDFQSWVNGSRLGLPTGSSLMSAGAGTGDNESNTSSGSASSDSVRALRHTVFEINKAAGVATGNNPVGLSGGNDLYAGMWDTTNGFSDYTDFNLLSDTSQVSAIERANTLLKSYQSGSRYTASAWETAVNGALSEHHKGDFGSTPSTSDAGSNNNTIYGMFSNTDEASDWLDRDITDNEAIFTGSAYSSSDGQWSGNSWNIFSNGDLLAPTPSNPNPGLPTAVTDDVLYPATVGTTFGDATDPATAGALSTAAMYNYLSSAFSDSAVSVYSSANASSEYVKQSHFSANLIGSGALRFVYALNCIAVIGISTVLGLFYGLGMCISNIKRGVRLLAQIPGAMMGVLSSIVQVIVYVFIMILELLCTIFLYSFMNQIIMMFATAIEGPLESALVPSGLIGGNLAAIGSGLFFDTLYNCVPMFTVGLLVVTLGVMFLGAGAMKACRVVLVAYEYFWCKVFRACTLKEFRPVFDQWFANRNSLYVYDVHGMSLLKSLRQVWSVSNTKEVVAC